MKSEEFVRLVRMRANLRDDAEAQRAVTATLQTLGEIFFIPAILRLDSRLAPRCHERLTGNQTTPFYERAALHEGLPLTQSEPHARAVLAVLRETLTKCPNDGQNDGR